MNPNPPPEYANKPNLWRVACELAQCKNPDKVLAALKTILSGTAIGMEQEDEPRP